MKRLYLIPIILLAASLGVLGVMIGVRVIGTQREISANIKTQTAIVEQATATLPPSDTPSPTNTPILTPADSLPSATVTPFPTATPRPGEVIEEGCNVAEYIADVTVPDKTVLDADTKFTKTWRLLNNGTCTWTNQYKLAFHSGEQMEGPNRTNAISLPVEPGKLIDISVSLRAPKAAGTYKGFWILEDQYGNTFGLGQAGKPFYVEIVVVE